MYLWMLIPTFCWVSTIVAGKEALLGFNPLALAQLPVGNGSLSNSMVVARARGQMIEGALT
jgi:hypothetical protein